MPGKVLLAAISYLALVLAASAPLASTPKGDAPHGRVSALRDAAAFAAGLFSTFALPWGGAPPISAAGNFGADGTLSWLWFPSASLALVFLEGCGVKLCAPRRCFALANASAAAAALEIFVLREGVPGGVPGIEGLSAVLVLESLTGARVVAAMAMFFATLAISYSRAFLDDGPAVPAQGKTRAWARSVLDFSYCAFLSIVFVPSQRVLLTWMEPGPAAALDFVVKFAAALSIKRWIIRPLAKRPTAETPSWLTASACLTASAIFLLFF
ncbi:MAG: hypothetical protein LBS75_10070 [Synergistaceae bacterium]|nr:hypothetical protein [Synergistaceae bacterium]